MTPASETGFTSCWAIVEVFGHQRFAGLLGEQVIAGDKLLRLDIPESPETRQSDRGSYCPGHGYAKPGHAFQFEMVLDPVPAATKLFGVKAIYCITPCTEEEARIQAAAVSRGKRIENVTEVALVQQIEAPNPDADDETEGAVGLSATYHCEFKTCTNEQTFEGDSEDDCDVKARQAGWRIPEVDAEAIECPTCAAKIDQKVSDLAIALTAQADREEAQEAAGLYGVPVSIPAAETNNEEVLI